MRVRVSFPMLEVVWAKGELELQPVDVVPGKILLDIGEAFCAHLRIYPVEGVFALAADAPLRMIHAELPVERVVHVSRIHRMVEAQACEEFHAILVRAADE